MPEDPRWMAYLPEVRKYQEKPLKRSMPLNGEERPEGFDQWYETNVCHQRQEGHVVATINLPLGDLSAWQIRELADLARRFTGENVRITDRYLKERKSGDSFQDFVRHIGQKELRDSWDETLARISHTQSTAAADLDASTA